MRTFAVLATVACAATLAACDKGGDEGGDTGKVTFPAGNNNISFTAGDATAKTVTFSTTEPWTASVAETTRAVSWLEVVPSSGPAGQNQSIEIRLTATGNLSSARSADVTITAGGEQKSFRVTQPAGSYDPIAIDITGPRNSPAAGEQFDVNITCAGYWSAGSDNKNVATVSPANGTGNATVTVTVGKNYRTTADGATLTFNTQGVDVQPKTLAINRAAGAQNYYKLWDYYPDHDNPQTAQGIVVWLDNPEGGSGEPNILGPVDGWSLHGIVLHKTDGNPETFSNVSVPWYPNVEPLSSYWYLDVFLPGDPNYRERTWNTDILNNWNDGKAATKHMIEYSMSTGTGSEPFRRLETQTPVFFWIRSLSSGEYLEGEDIEWWLPSVNEWKRVMAGYHGLRYEDMADWGILQNMPKTGLEQVRNNFNARLAAIPGGAGIKEIVTMDEVTGGGGSYHSDQRYYTSNLGTNVGGIVMIVNPRSGRIGSVQETSGDRARAIKKF